MQSVNLNHHHQDESGDFKDVCFKLVAIESLCSLDRAHLVNPDDFECDPGIEYPEDVMPDFYGPYLPILQEYLLLEFEDEHLASIEELVWDGGDAVFGSIAPNWDGEDDLFDILDYETDLILLPNLKRFTAAFTDEELERLNKTYPDITFIQI